VNVAVCFLWYVSVCVESVRSKNVHGDPVMLGSRPSLFGDSSSTEIPKEMLRVQVSHLLVHKQRVAFKN